jgi:hypothetical protein
MRVLVRFLVYARIKNTFFFVHSHKYSQLSDILHRFSVLVVCRRTQKSFLFTYCVLEVIAVVLQAIAGWSSLAARRAHNPKVVGSNPAPATS